MTAFDQTSPYSLNDNPFGIDSSFMSGANGVAGSLTPASQTNAQNQQTGGSSNPFTDVLNHVTAFNAQPQNVPADPTGGGNSGATTTTTQKTLQPGLPYENPATPKQHAVAPVQPPAPVPPAGNTGGVPINADTHDPNGVPYGPNNQPPKPDNTEDPEIAASWYRKYQFLDPSLKDITGADVSAYRISGYQATPEVLAKTPYGNNFIAWWQNGKQSPAQQPQGGGTAVAPPAGGTQPYNSATGVDGWGLSFSDTSEAADRQRFAKISPSGTEQQFQAWRSAWRGTAPAGSTVAPDGLPQPGTGTAPPPQATPPAPPIGTPPPTQPVGVTPPPAPPPAATGTSDPSTEIKKLIDLYSQTYSDKMGPNIEGLLNPMFARQRQQLARDINAQGAALGSGVVDSGGFGANRNEALSNLSGQQSGILAGELSKENLAKIEQNTKFAELATESGMTKFVTEFNGQLSRDNVKTNADLQKWLESEDNILKKYGIDSNDVLQRYLGKLGIDKANIDANATIQSAQLHAAAAEAAANASTSASLANAKLQYDLGMAGLGVDREKNIGDFIIRLLGGGNASIDNINNILTGIPPGSVVVKP